MMAVGDWNWEMGEGGNVLVTEEMCLGDDLRSIQLGARGRERLGFRVGPASSQRGLLQAACATRGMGLLWE